MNSPVVTRSTRPWQTAAIFAGIWALTSAFLCWTVFENGRHLAPEGPVPVNGWSFLMLFAALLALPTPIWALLQMRSGWRYLRRRPLGQRWQAGWVVLAVAGLGIQSLLAWSAYSDCSRPRGCQLPPRGDLRPLELLAAFVAAGAAMIVTLILAAKRSEPALPAQSADRSTTSVT